MAASQSQTPALLLPLTSKVHSIYYAAALPAAVLASTMEDYQPVDGAGWMSGESDFYGTPSQRPFRCDQR